MVRLIGWKRDTTIGTYFRSPLHFPLQAATGFAGSSTAGDAGSGGSRRASTSSTSALGPGAS